jgi:hypothetical protein
MKEQKFQKGDKVTILDSSKIAIVVKYKTKKGSTTKFVVIEWDGEDEKFESSIPEDALRKVE